MRKAYITKLTIFIILLLLPVMIAGCIQQTDNISNEQSVEEIKDLVNYYSTNEVSDESAVITSEELIVKKGNEEKVYKLPKDEFFVSIAPYIEQTHP